MRHAILWGRFLNLDLDALASFRHRPLLLRIQAGAPALLTVRRLTGGTRKQPPRRGEQQGALRLPLLEKVQQEEKKGRWEEREKSSMEGGLIDAAVEERQQQQRDEIELLEAVYAAEFSLIPNGSEIQFKFALCSQREHFLWARLPALYPVQPPVWEVRSRTLSRAGRRAVEEAARKVLEQSPEGVACCLQLLQATEEALADFKEEEAASTSQRGPHQTPAPQAPTQAVLGRRLLFSHHIIARSKRDGIRSEAKDLNIGGYAKIGWPGVIVIEGEESDCTEYVRRLMRWRWKQLVVRGEEQHVLPAGEDLNEHRRLPQKMTELGEKEMSLLGQLCKEAGLHELFMTHIK